MVIGILQRVVWYSFVQKMREPAVDHYFHSLTNFNTFTIMQIKNKWKRVHLLLMKNDYKLRVKDVATRGPKL